jgi:hypothetical protein
MPMNQKQKQHRQPHKRFDMIFREVEAMDTLAQNEPELKEAKTLEEWLAMIERLYEQRKISEDQRHAWLVDALAEEEKLGD